METLRAGEFGRDIDGLRGEGLRRIECKIGLAIVFEPRRGGDGEDGEEEEEMKGIDSELNRIRIFVYLFGTFRSYSKTGKQNKIKFKGSAWRCLVSR